MCHICAALPHNSIDHAVYLEITEEFNKLKESIWAGKIKPGDVNKNITSIVGKELTSAAELGYNKNLKDVIPGTEDYRLLSRFEMNSHKFSAFKNHRLISELKNYANDKAVTKKQFDDIAAMLNNTYHKNYLATEKQHTLASSQMAERWQDIQRDKEYFPYLKYVTAGDERVRATHVARDGVTKKVDDHWWKRNYPPLPGQYGCRCTVEQLYKADETRLNKDNQGITSGPDTNVGVTGNQFQKHPYYNDIEKEMFGNIEAVAAETAPMRKYYEGVDGGEVVMSSFQLEKEIEYNYNTALKLALEGNKIVFPPYVNRQSKSIAFSNPDVKVNEVLGDFKTPQSPNLIKGIENVIGYANKRELSLVIIDLTERTDVTEHALIRSLQINLQPIRHKFIKEVWFMLKNKPVVKIPRSYMKKNKYAEVIKQL